MKPSIFIGASTAAHDLAKAIKDSLALHFNVDLWSDHLFEIGNDTLNSLLTFVQVYDFAVLVMTDDDQLVRDGGTQAVPRDNVVFELGLFMGALGRRRAFTVVARNIGGAVKLPTDMLGNTELRLPPGFHKAIDYAQLPALLQPIFDAVRKRSAESTLQLLPSTGLAIGYFQNFLLPVCQKLAETVSVEVEGAPVDISRNNFEFTVVLPATLSDASIEGAKRFTRDHNAKDFLLPTGSRKFPFYVSTSLVDGRLIFYDYPTTLRASHEAIRIALAGPYLGATEHHKMLDQKEIWNFERTLRILLDDGAAAGFRRNIKFIQLK